ncbi:LysR family transcriptional regulator [Propionibacterium freudenreichii]|uniref:LysR family transcriptional regulator n=1 Tax=Propionibacterium freudenreichii TaxID=1744 RepID=UPI0005420FD6|nr:LysR family transcriptional regulator [Propionibacterium freudenreichii]MDK9643290.1 LysR family transcriptional regulator [Propionibacterium freudenreichii]CEG86125.1 Transcriptional regulator, LysR family protein [Propionibacterium freudenreichii]CEI26428.1 Transcriptional regulator, LysR family protein [Propionibacterium freudenreichii]
MDEPLDTTTLREVLADLPFLVAVADEGGITAAAEVMGVPQPSVSRAMARLSDRIGAPLLRRDRRGVALTDAGTTLLDYARSTRTAALAGVTAVHRELERAGASVTIAFQHTFGRRVVPALLRALLADRPNAHVDLRQGARESCIDLFEKGVADAILVSPPLPPTKHAHTLRLYAEPLVLTVAPEHRLAGRDRVQLSELADERLLAMTPGYGLRTIVDELLRDAGISRTFAFEGEDIQTLRGLASAGLGVAILPPAIQPSDDVVEVPIDHPAARREIGVSWHGDAAPAGSAAAALQDLLARDHRWVDTPGGHGKIPSPRTKA